MPFRLSVPSGPCSVGGGEGRGGGGGGGGASDNCFFAKLAELNDVASLPQLPPSLPPLSPSAIRVPAPRPPPQTQSLATAQPSSFFTRLNNSYRIFPKLTIANGWASKSRSIIGKIRRFPSVSFGRFQRKTFPPPKEANNRSCLGHQAIALGEGRRGSGWFLGHNVTEPETTRSLSASHAGQALSAGLRQ